MDALGTGDDFASVVERDELERAFRHLSVEHRAVLVLTHYVGLPAPEVAEVLGIPPGTVYSRLHYGLRTMRALLVSPASVPVALPEHIR
jgi:RNA polymerase sigma-70 factor (ECF subfamily)